MLRIHPTAPPSVSHPEDPGAEFPSEEEPYAKEDRPVGIRFYVEKQGFFHPYYRLQSMTYAAERLAIEFPEETIVITGRGLHGLYVGVARAQVSRIVQQGDHPGTQPTHVVRIRRVPRPVRGREASGQSEADSGDGTE